MPHLEQVGFFIYLCGMISIRPLIKILGKIIELPSNAYLDPKSLGSGTPSNNNVLTGDGSWTEVKTINSNSILGSGNLTISDLGLFIHKETTLSAAVTGTLTETEVYALTIPANSFSAGDKFVLDGIIVEKTGTAGTAAIRVKLSTSATLPAGITDRIANPQLAASNIAAIFGRKYNINGGVIIGRGFGSGGAPSEYTDGITLGSQSFDPTVTNYLYISVLLGDVNDSVVVHGYTLKNL
jgi:hypothetical protein